MDFDEQSKIYKQVRIQNGGGLRQMSVKLSSTMTDILHVALQLYFPAGVSKKGLFDEFEFRVCTADNVVVEECNVGEIYERTKVKRLRLNICSQKSKRTQETHSDSPSSTETLSVCRQNALSHSRSEESGGGTISVSFLANYALNSCYLSLQHLLV